MDSQDYVQCSQIIDSPYKDSNMLMQQQQDKEKGKEDEENQGYNIQITEKQKQKQMISDYNNFGNKYTCNDNNKQTNRQQLSTVNTNTPKNSIDKQLKPYQQQQPQFQIQIEQYNQLSSQQKQQQVDNYEVSAPVLHSQSSQFSQPPLLVYSYSGISNASSTPEFTMHSSRVSQQGNSSSMGSNNTATCGNNSTNYGYGYGYGNNVGYNFIKAEKLYGCIQKLVREVKEALSLQDDIAMYLLYKNQWSKEKLYENYTDIALQFHLINNQLKENLSNINKMKNKMHSSSSSPNNNNKQFINNINYDTTITKQTSVSATTSSINNNIQFCQICQTSPSQYPVQSNLICKHLYCKNCWQQYLKQQLQNNNHIFFTCMNKCQNSIIMPHHFIQIHYPQYFQLYRKLICINYTTNNRSLSYCPYSYLVYENTGNNGGNGVNNNGKIMSSSSSTPNLTYTNSCNAPTRRQCDLFCQRMQSSYYCNSSDICIQCQQCSNFYCFYCRREPHYPATCEDIIKWYKLLNDQQINGNINMKWIENNTKKCPSCKKSVQKFIGCSKIRCICGIQFCYECNGKWDQRHNSGSKGECVEGSGILARKSSMESRMKTNDFLNLHQKVLQYTRTQKKNIQTLTLILDCIKQQWILSKFSGIRKQITQAWLALKWGNIISFIYKKKEQDTEIQQSFIQSIVKLMQSVQKLQTMIVNNSNNINTIMMCPKDMLTIGQEVLIKREIVRKSKDIWLESWRNCN